MTTRSADSRRRRAGLGLAVLAEVHNRRELDRVLGAGAAVIGVNNRNLRTLAVDLEASRTLVEAIPEGIVAVAESGLRAPADLRELRSAGYDAFLIGESLIEPAGPGRGARGHARCRRPGAARRTRPGSRPESSDNGRCESQGVRHHTTGRCPARRRSGRVGGRFRLLAAEPALRRARGGGRNLARTAGRPSRRSGSSWMRRSTTCGVSPPRWGWPPCSFTATSRPPCATGCRTAC